MLTDVVATLPKVAVAPAALGTPLGFQFVWSFQEPPAALVQVNWAAARGAAVSTRATAAVAHQRRWSRRFMGVLQARSRRASNQRNDATSDREPRPHPTPAARSPGALPCPPCPR